MDIKSPEEEKIFNDILTSGVLRISSHHTNLLYRLTFKIIKEYLSKSSASQIIYISSKTIPMSLLTTVVTVKLLDRFLVKQIHSFEELMFILKLYFVRIKDKTIKISGIFIDSLDHLLLERQFSFAEIQNLQKLLNKLRYRSIKSSMTVYLINKDKIELESFWRNTMDFKELDYSINDKIIVQRESTGVYFMQSLKNKKIKFLIKNPEEVNDELYF